MATPAPRQPSADNVAATIQCSFPRCRRRYVRNSDLNKHVRKRHGNNQECTFVGCRVLIPLDLAHCVAHQDMQGSALAQFRIPTPRQYQFAVPIVPSNYPLTSSQSYPFPTQATQAQTNNDITNTVPRYFVEPQPTSEPAPSFYGTGMGIGSSSMSSYPSYTESSQSSQSLQTQQYGYSLENTQGLADAINAQYARASNHDTLEVLQPQQYGDNSYHTDGSAEVSQARHTSSSNSDQISETDVASINESQNPEGDSSPNNRGNQTRTFTEMMEDSDVEIDDAH